MNWFIVAYMEGLVLLLTLIPALLWVRDFYRYSIKKDERVIVLRKNGTYDVIAKSSKGAKSINVDGLERKISAKSIFTGRLGNIIVLPETSSEAIRADKLEVQSDIAPEDLNTIGELSFFAGQVALLRNKLQAMTGQLILAVLVIVVMNMIMIFKLSSDFNTAYKSIVAALNAIKASLGG
jgi:hypothetical protein